MSKSYLPHQTSSAVTRRIVQPGGLCAMKRSAGSRSTGERFGRGLNLAATSAPGHVTVAPASVAPELNSTPISKLIDDKRSVVSMAQSMTYTCRTTVVRYIHNLGGLKLLLFSFYIRFIIVPRLSQVLCKSSLQFYPNFSLWSFFPRKLRVHVLK